MAPRRSTTTRWSPSATQASRMPRCAPISCAPGSAAACGRTMTIYEPSADDALLAAYHRGLYWDEFAEQHEPLAAWQRALRGEEGYQLIVRLVLDPEARNESGPLHLRGEAILAGINYEHYPRSGCGLVTY